MPTLERFIVSIAVLTAPVVAPLAAPLAAQQRALSYEDFAAVRAVADPQISPDGALVLYTVRTTDVDANRRTAHTYVVSSAGGAPRPWPTADVSATEARWSPDGRRVAFIAGGQLWIADADGSNARQITTLNGGATGPVWSPTGDHIAFTSAVHPQCSSDACNVQADSVRNASKVKAHIADRLLYRHWVAWDEGTRSHLFVVAPDGSELRDLVPGATYDVPPGPFGGSEGYAFSADGREIAYTAKDQGRADAWSTDLNVYTVPVDGGPSTVMTATNRGADQNPVYSPDGRFIVYASQKTPGFESDRWRLMAYDRGARTARELLPTWDRNADAYFFAPDESAIYVITADAAREKLFRVPLERATAGASLLKAGTPKVVVGEHNNAGFTLSSDGKSLAWLRDATERPAEVYLGAIAASGTVTARQLSHENDALVAKLDLHPAEDYWFTGANGARVQGFVVKPPGYVAGKKYPTVLLIHGGPQGAWFDQWHSRWNYQMFAAPGFGLVIINPRGSTGYGQKFVDEVSQDWGARSTRISCAGSTPRSPDSRGSTARDSAPRAARSAVTW